MRLLKKVCVLKQIANGYSYSGKDAKGMAKCEKKGNENCLEISLMDVAPLKKGRYVAFISSSQKGVYFDCDETGLEKEFSDFIFDLEAPFSITIILDDDLSPYPVLFGQTENNDQTPSSATDEYILLKRKNKEEREKEEKLIDKAYSESESDTFNLFDEEVLNKSNIFTDKPSPDGYADDVVATENYFEKADVDAKNLTLKEDNEISEKQNKFFKLKKSFENGSYPIDEPPNENSCPQEEPTQTPCQINAERENDEQFKRQGNNFKNNSCECTFLQEDLETVMNSYPEFYELEKSVYGSKWVRIELAKGEYYFGKASIHDKKYLCYAVRGQKDCCPEELKDLSCFIPCQTSDEEGFFVMFQNEVDGKIIKN